MDEIKAATEELSKVTKGISEAFGAIKDVFANLTDEELEEMLLEDGYDLDDLYDENEEEYEEGEDGEE